MGADKGWIENGTNNLASYTALRPGKYNFHMNATDKMVCGARAFKELRIIIHPPFWATWWAYDLCVIGLSLDKVVSCFQGKGYNQTEPGF